MSAIVEAVRMSWLRAGFAMIAGDHEQTELWAATVGVACNTITAASNAAGAGRVVEGAPRTWAVRWRSNGDKWVALVDHAAVTCVRVNDPPTTFASRPLRSFNLRPCWDAANRLWCWGSPGHNPRPCAWPRPFATRGA